MTKIEILGLYRDGGTHHIKIDDDKEYHIDYALGSLTRGGIFNGWPKRDKSNRVDPELEKQIHEAIAKHGFTK